MQLLPLAAKAVAVLALPVKSALIVPAEKLLLPSVNSTVPLASGKVMVFAAVGSVTASVVALASAVAPSKISGDAPCSVPLTVMVSVAASPKVVLPLITTLSLAVVTPAASTQALVPAKPLQT